MSFKLKNCFSNYILSLIYSTLFFWMQIISTNYVHTVQALFFETKFAEPNTPPFLPTICTSSSFLFFSYIYFVFVLFWSLFLFFLGYNSCLAYTSSNEKMAVQIKATCNCSKQNKREK